MRNALEGDADSYQTLLTELASVLASFLRPRMADAAAIDDVTQDILISIHLSRATYDIHQPFAPWFFTIARRRYVDYLRKNERLKSREIVERELALMREEPLKIRELDRILDLEKVLQSLPEKQLEAFELVKLQGLSTAEAAAKSGLSESAVKVYAHRAVKNLRKRLESD